MAARKKPQVRKNPKPRNPKTTAKGRAADRGSAALENFNALPPGQRAAAQRAVIGGGKRGQRLAAGAASYVSPNIAGPGAPVGVTPGAFDSGDIMQRIARNEYISSLGLDDRARYLNQTGYFTGGVPQATPKGSRPDLSRYKTPGTYQIQQGGVYSGTVTVDQDGKASYSPLRKRSPKGKGRGKRPGKTKGRPGAGGGRGGTTGGAGGSKGTLGLPVSGASTNGASVKGAFASGVSGSSLEFIKEFGQSRFAEGESEAGKAGQTKKKKGKGRKLVKRAAKKSGAPAKKIRKALRTEGISKQERKLYARAPKKISSRLRMADRRNDRKKS